MTKTNVPAPITWEEARDAVKTKYPNAFCGEGDNGSGNNYWVYADEDGSYPELPNSLFLAAGPDEPSAWLSAHSKLGGAEQPKEANMSDPTPMAKRPSIESITYISAEGNPHVYAAGRNCSKLREVEENGEYCLIPWVEVWDGDNLIARFNQHKLEHIIYKRGNQ